MRCCGYKGRGTRNKSRLKVGVANGFGDELVNDSCGGTCTAKSESARVMEARDRVIVTRLDRFSISFGLIDHKRGFTPAR